MPFSKFIYFTNFQLFTIQYRNLWYNSINYKFYIIFYEKGYFNMKKILLVIALLFTITLPSYSWWEVLVGPAVNVINSITSPKPAADSNKSKEPDTATLDKNEKRYEKDLNNPKKRQAALDELITINLKQKDIETAKKYYYMLENTSVYNPFLSIVREYQTQKNYTGLEEFLLSKIVTTDNKLFNNRE